MIAALFLCFWGFYTLYASPTIYWDDSGEFVTGAYLMGNVHPSGYPFYLLLGKLGLSLPIEGKQTLSFATPMSGAPFRMNLLSVLLSALTLVTVYLLLLRLKLSDPVALLTAACLGMSMTFWSKALIAEVYALVMLFFALNAYFLAVLLEVRDRRLALLWLFVLGFSALVHHMLAAFVPIYLLYIFVLRGRQRLSLRWLPAFAFLAMTGAMVYAYLPLRSAAEPALNWWKPDTVSSFVNNVFLGGYSYGYPTIRVMLLRLQSIDIVGELGWPALTLMALGGLGAFFRWRRYRLWFLYIAAGCLGAAALIEHGEPEIFKLPLLVILVLGLGFAADRIYRSVRRIRIASAVLGWIALGGLAAAGIGYPFLAHDRLVDLRYNEWPYIYGRHLLESMPLDGESTLVVSGAQADFTTLYLQKVEGVRRDVRIIPLTFLAMEWKRDELRNRYGAVRRTPNPRLKECDILPPPGLRDRREPICHRTDRLGVEPPGEDCCMFQLPLSFPHEAELRDMLERPDRLGLQRGTLWFLASIIDRNMPPGSAPINRRFFFSEYSELIAGASLAGQEGVTSAYYLAPTGNFFQILTPDLAQAHLPDGRPYRIEEPDFIFIGADLTPHPLTRMVASGNAIERCRAHLNLFELSYAEITCRMALGFKPDSAAAMSNLGVIAKQKAAGYNSAAESMNREARRVGTPHPSPVNTLAMVTEAFIETGDLPHPPAPSLIGMARSLGRASILRIQAVEYRRLADEGMHAAEEWVYKALDLEPDNHLVHYQVSLLEKDRGNFAEAARAARAAVQLEPGFVRAYVNLGSALASMERFGEAESAYRRALEIQPGHTIALANLAMLYIYMNRAADAIVFADKAELLAQGNPELMLLVGQVFLELHTRMRPSPVFVKRAFDNCAGALESIAMVLGDKGLASHPMALQAQQCMIEARREALLFE